MKEKNNSILVIVIVILSILLVGVTGFTTWYILSEKNNENINNNNNDKPSENSPNQNTNINETPVLPEKDDKEYFVTIQNCITYIVDSKNNIISDDEKYAIDDIDSDGYDDIIYYSSIDDISWKYIIFRGSSKGFYIISESDKLHKSHSKIIKEKGKNYLTYVFAHMGYETITNFYFTNNGLDKKVILDTEYKGDDVKYKSDGLVDTLKWKKVS